MKSSNGSTRLHCPVACTSITLIRDRVTCHVSRVTCSTHTSAVPSVFTLDQWLLDLCLVMFCCIVITSNIGPTVQFRPGPAPPYVIVMAHYIRLSGATHWSRVTPYGPWSAELLHVYKISSNYGDLPACSHTTWLQMWTYSQWMDRYFTPVITASCYRVC